MNHLSTFFGSLMQHPCVVKSNLDLSHCLSARRIYLSVINVKMVVLAAELVREIATGIKK